tara:strand:+ start:120 stop:302 length:183 start_codon:yes stop_codon:yes gene_type:complete
MQLNITSSAAKRRSRNIKLLKTIIYILIFLGSLFILEKFNFPYPKQEIKKNITNEIIKLK